MQTLASVREVTWTQMLSHDFFLACELTISYISMRTGSPNWWIHRYDGFRWPASCVCVCVCVRVACVCVSQQKKMVDSSPTGYRNEVLPGRPFSYHRHRTRRRKTRRLVRWYSHFDRDTDGVDGRDTLGLSKIGTWGRRVSFFPRSMDGAQAVNTVYPVHGV